MNKGDRREVRAMADTFQRVLEAVGRGESIDETDMKSG